MASPAAERPSQQPRSGEEGGQDSLGLREGLVEVRSPGGHSETRQARLQHPAPAPVTPLCLLQHLRGCKGARAAEKSTNEVSQGPPSRRNSEKGPRAAPAAAARC